MLSPWAGTSIFEVGRRVLVPCSRSRPGHITLSFRNASSSSSRRWQTRQGVDRFTKDARLHDLKGRAAFKLLEINEKHKIFTPGQTVVDLGYAPGSWAQVAVDRTFPNGRVVGVDIIPAQPPRGVSTIQGNFLSPSVQEEVRLYVQETGRGRPKRRRHLGGTNCNEEAVTVEELDESSTDYIELEKQSLNSSRGKIDEGGFAPATDHMLEGKEKLGEKVVDVVLSDMSAPWVQPSVSWNKSLSDPYNRMINTSGTAFRDHAGSMDLCAAALRFAFDTLKTGGHFVCKFYQGAEDKGLERQLRTLFAKVHREKPESSRSVCELKAVSSGMH